MPLQSRLLSWFQQVAREMPWRESRDPYAIWVSEIMLQQTQVSTVGPYFERFMQAFPDLQALAAAPLEQVLKHWEGLGYYSRARNLHRGAQYVHQHCGGHLPQTLSAILQVPGIGPYSAGAILSIAYGVPEPAVDGNVIRVFSRLDAIATSFESAASRRALEERIRPLIPATAAGDFNQALMELGALVCRPRQPDCPHCPLQPDCAAYAAGQPEAYPVKHKKTAVKLVNLQVALIADPQGRYLLQKQGKKGVFREMWCLPWLELSEKPVLSQPESQLELAWGEAVTELEHVLTHRRLKMRVHRAELRHWPEPWPQELIWLDPQQNPDHAVPVAHQKILALLQQKL